MKTPASITNILNSLHDSKNHFQDVKNGFLARLSLFRSSREKEKQQDLENDFNNVLEAWGIIEVGNVPNVVFCLRLRIVILAVLPLLYVLVAITGLTGKSFLIFGLVAVPCLFGIMTTAWRIWVLKHSRFMPFDRWLMTGCGLWA